MGNLGLLSGSRSVLHVCQPMRSIEEVFMKSPRTLAATIFGMLVIRGPAPGPSIASAARCGTTLQPQTTPTITWNAPEAISYGTALSDKQLNATASVPGTFVYAPPAGTVLQVGVQTLKVDFTPSDTENFTSASATVNITVNHRELLPAEIRMRILQCG